LLLGFEVTLIFLQGRLALGSKALETCLTFNSVIPLAGFYPEEKLRNKCSLID
jgi:hypothetical protein